MSPEKRDGVMEVLDHLHKFARTTGSRPGDDVVAYFLRAWEEVVSEERERRGIHP